MDVRKKQSNQFNQKLKQQKTPGQKKANKLKRNAHDPLALFLPVFWELRTSRKLLDRKIKLEKNVLGFSVTLAVAGIL